MDIISDLQYKVEQCLNNNEDIIKLNLAFKKDEYQMQYEIEPDAQKEIIIINAYDFEEIEGAFQKVTYYTISLDPKRKQLFFPL